MDMDLDNLDRKKKHRNAKAKNLESMIRLGGLKLIHRRLYVHLRE